MMYILTLLLISGIYNGLIFFKGFEKAGYNPWLAFVPIYTTIIQLRIIKEVWWWVFLFWIPVINNIMFISLFFNWLSMFGYHKKRYTILAVLTLGLFIIYVNYTRNILEEKQAVNPKTLTGWIASVFFAIVVATLVHNYFIQPFIIPTSSLEKTLLVGDFLFVSKFHYGARVPMTPLSFPMVHDTLPVIKTKSYLDIDAIRLPYMRLPRLQKVKHNDIVVFSWPVDTVVKFFSRNNIHVKKPLDKKSNYVKRCVGIPGDTLSIVDGYVHINGKKNILPDSAKLQFSYIVKMKPGQSFNKDILYKKYDVTESVIQYKNDTYVCYGLTDEVVDALKKSADVLSIVPKTVPKDIYESSVFPHDPELVWNQDHLGPVILPKKGMTIALTLENLSIYRRAIEIYEGHSISTEGFEIKIDEKAVTSYTFNQGYYWMMGDNRHRSEDSRFWGMVPENHIIGKPIFIWMSIDWSNGLKIRWDRVFAMVDREGKPVSYLKHFIIVTAVLYGVYYYVKRKKRKNRQQQQ